MEIDIKANWGITPDKIEEIKLNNPLSQTKIYRVNDKYLLKSDTNKALKFKERELYILNILKKNNIRVPEVIGNKIVNHGSKIYQLFEYIPSDKIQFTSYNKNKITSISNELAKISRITSLDNKYDSIKNSIENIKDEIIKKIPDNYLKTIKEALKHLSKNLFSNIPYLNKTFSHGDLHPDNILWKDDSLYAIIDWEIAGKREELYDIAFLIGCIGIENPIELKNERVKSLLRIYVKDAKPTKLSVTCLPELVLATRIKWLYKWLLNSKDTEIIDMEVKLIEIILKKTDELRKTWTHCIGSDFKYSKNKWVLQDRLMIKDIEKAKERLAGIDLFSVTTRDNIEQFATDLRLIAIDYGAKDDILKVIGVLNLLKLISIRYMDNTHVLIERVIAGGNVCLDFSKLRMMDAIKMSIEDIKSIVDQHKDIAELNIGYACCLRNSSIAFSETKDYNKAYSIIEKLSELNKEIDIIEVKEEYARGLSNIITTILSNSLKKDVTSYYSELEELYSKYKDSRKIHGAYIVAKSNLTKARVVF